MTDNSGPTDDELNRRVAELDGWIHSRSDVDVWSKPGHQLHEILAPPYLTDWRLTGGLFDQLDKIDNSWRLWPSRVDVPNTQRAICLAFIAWKESQNEVS